MLYIIYKLSLYTTHHTTSAYTQILPGLLDDVGRVLESYSLRHEEKATDLHQVPMALPGLLDDAGQGGLGIFTE